MNSVENEEDELLLKFHNEAFERGSNAVSLRASEVVAYSSQYGLENSVSYAAENILGPITIYPRAGDHVFAFQMKTYGRWQNSLPSCRRIVSILPIGTFAESQDFIEIRVEKRVVPLLLRVYEVYNPGAIVKIFCYCYETERWVVLWQGAPQILPPDKSHCFSAEFEGINFLTDYYRIEFHHSHLQYYSEIDAIILYGEEGISPSLPNYSLAPKNFLYPKVAFKHSNNSTRNKRKENGPDENTKFSAYFETLPKEVMHLILGLLDFRTLCIAAQVSRLFYTECYDPIVCKEINLNLYWHLVNASTLKGLHSRLKVCKRLNLSWCGNQGRIPPSCFVEFLETTYPLLMYLNLSSCSFVNDNALKAIATYCSCLQELILQSCRSSDLTRTGFNYISLIRNLTYLDLYRTLIDDSSILSIIKSCSKLEHLFLGSCIGIKDFNEVAQAIGRNLKNLKTLDLWRATSLNCTGVKEIAEHCNDLLELDLGWCNLIEARCGCIQQLLSNCAKVKKLVLSGIRSVSNNDVDIIAFKCKAIEQLDILGLTEVTIDAVRNLLQSCKMLKLLDVSYCNTSVKSAMSELQETFPRVEIKCSIQPDTMMFD